MIKGKILGYVISKAGIFIDCKRIDAITTITYPNNNKTIQSFWGKVNFVYRFILRFVEIIKHFKNMIKEDAIFKSNHEIKEAFQ